MKKGLIFATTLAMALGVGVAVSAHQGKAAKVEAVSAGQKVYLDPGIWTADNAWFALYTFGGTTGSDWVKLEKVDDTSYYSATLADNTGAIFCRMDPSKTALDWDSKWNQTRDLTIPTDNKNLYSITGWGENDGKWSHYDEPVPPTPVDENYYLKGDFNEWTVSEEYKFTVDAEDSNKYVLEDVEIAAGEAMKGFKAENNWYGVDHDYEGCGWTVGEGGNCVVSEAGTYTVTLYVNSEDGNHLTISSGEPGPEPGEDVPAEDGYYLVGSESNWKYEGATKMTAGDDGDLAKLIGYEAKAGEEFKIRGYHNKKDTWYTWGQAEEGHGEDNYVVGEEARTLDIFLNFEGNYYVFDHSEPGPEPVDENYYLKGDFNDWTVSEEYKFTVDAEDASKYVLEDVEIAAGEAMKGFKAENNWYGVDHDYEGCGWTVGEDGNCVVTAAGTYTVTLYVNSEDGNHLTISSGEEPEPEPVDNNYYLRGDFNEWAISEDYIFTVDAEDPNKYVLEDVEIAAGEGMKAYKEKDLWFGVDHTYDDCGWTVGEGEDAGNCIVTEAGKYTVTLYVHSDDGNHLAISNGETPEPPAPVDENYYLKGDFNEWTVSEEYKFTVDAEDANHYVLEEVEIGAGEAMKGFKAENNWYGVDHDYEGCGWTVGEDGNCVVSEAGTYTVNLYVNSEDGNHLAISKPVDPDFPEHDGYYIVGSATGWKFAGAAEMGAGTGGNIAELHGYEATVGDEFKVRGYKDGVSTYYNWGNAPELDPGANYVVTGEKDAKVTLDIFLNGEGLFYVAEHVDSYQMTIVGHKTSGVIDEGEFSLGVQYAYAGDTFNPDITPQEGYAVRGVFTDKECTTEYEPKEITEAGTLYVLYTKLGYYLAGGADETFSIDTATPLHGDETNKIVGTVTVPEGASAETPYKVKPLEFVADAGEGKPGWQAIAYTMGHEVDPDFVHFDEDGNFAFTEKGTYAFYVNNENKVWFNGGEYAFHAKFLTEIGGICDAQGKTTDIAALKLKWAEMETAYKQLSEAEQKNIKDVGFDGGDEKSSDDRLKMVAKYAYIVTKYGTAEFKDFIWGQTDIAPAYNGAIDALDVSNNNNMIIVVSAIAATTAIALGVLLVLKKRKHQ